MATMIRCDRCGVQETTKGTMVGAAIPVFRETPLPDGWRRPVLPQEDGSAWKRDLCPGCVNALWKFMESPAWFDGPAEAADEPCPSCGHDTGIHDNDDRCWYTVKNGVPGYNLVCPCAGPKGTDPEPEPEPEPDGEENPRRDRKACPVGTLDGCPGWYRVGTLDDHMQGVHGTSQR
jgi:hypothetical protein